MKMDLQRSPWRRSRRVMGVVLLAAGGLCTTLSACEDDAAVGRFCNTDEECDTGEDCTQSWCGDDDLCHHEPLDEDGDGVAALCAGGADCDDTRVDVRPAAPELCDDGADNDCDGLTDCDDPDCFYQAPCCAQNTEVCDNGFDDDCDDDMDCGDADCAGDVACCLPVAETCDDGVDNDCDGLTDCDDPDCETDLACCIPTPEICGDWVDNDCDRFIDCLDPDCHGDPACLCEPERCDDGVDNDCDGDADCADADCAAALACGGTPCAEYETGLLCGDPPISPFWYASPPSATQQYSCGGGVFPGPEWIGVAQVAQTMGPAPMLVGIEVSGNDGSYFLSVLDAGDLSQPDPTCDPGQCVASSSDPAPTDETIRFMAQAGQRFYLVLDSLADTGQYPTLRLTCRAMCFPEDCTDGWDNDCDGYADAWDSDCSGGAP